MSTEALREALDYVRRMEGSISAASHPLVRKLEAALARPEGSVEKDAARYRFLRNRCYVSGQGWLLGKAVPAIGKYDYNLAGEEARKALDAAIDAACSPQARDGESNV